MSRLSFLPLVPLVFFSLIGCGKRGGAEKPAPPPREIAVAIPLEREGTDWDEYTGRVEAIENVEIRARVSGYLMQIAFKDGDLVKKGDPLFVIDPRPYEAEVKRTTAEVARAKAQLSLARLESDRAESLRKTKAISVSDFDTKMTGLAQAEAAIQSAEAALDTAKLNLEFCHVTSPISGRVGRTLVTVGNLVEAETRLLTTVVSQSPMYVYFDADENALLRYQQVSTGDGWTTAGETKIPVELELANEKGFPHKGTLDFIDNRVDSGTGTIRLRGVFDNANGLLTPGLFARVRVPGSVSYLARLIPDSAVGTDQGNKFVLTVDKQNVVQYRRVETGPLHDGLRVIKSGIEPGERIATTGLQLVRPGTEIKPKLITLEKEAARKTAPKTALKAEPSDAPAPSSISAKNH